MPTSPTAIPAWPEAPSIDDVANFDTEADAWVGVMQPRTDAMNALGTNVYNNAVEANADAEATAADRIATGEDREAASDSAEAAAASALAAAGSASTSAGWSATSTTSMALTAGAKSLTIQTGKQFTAGTKTLVKRTSDPEASQAFTSVGTYTSGTGVLEFTLDADDITGSGTYTDWTVELSGERGRTGAPGATFTGGSLTSALNEAKATVASHATTADIWSAAGNLIDWTGTATTTAFPAAPQAGSRRRLLCAGACSFTHSANLQLPGAANYTAAAGDLVTVDAETTTKFRLTIEKADGTAVVGGGGQVGDVLITAGAAPDATYLLPARHYLQASYPVLFGMLGLLSNTYSTEARTLPSSSNWNSVTYGGGLFVAVSQTRGTAAATSPDGITWTARTLPSSSNWYSVTYGGGVFVAVAQGTAAATSPDGITWTARTLPSSSNWNSVTYGGGLFVAVAGGGTAAATSPDGITWTARTLPSSSNWYSVTYGGGLFVAVALSTTQAAIILGASYDTGTQFITPLLSLPQGLTSYIKGTA